MGMVVRTNTMAMNAQRQMGINNNKVSASLAKLSSGFKINSAADDAAGLAISEHMKAQIKNLDAASANSNDGISVAQTAEGALNEVHDMLNRMSELATKAANGVYTESQRGNYSDEVNQLQSEIDRIADSTNFNGIKLLNGNLAGGTTSTDGAAFNGATVGKATAAQAATAAAVADYSAIDTSTNKIDNLSVDGQKVAIDWTKGDAKSLATALKSQATAYTADAGKDIATKFQNVINSSMQEQGAKGSVTVTYDAAKGFTFKSDNKEFDSEFSFLGTVDDTGAAVANADTKSVMGVVLGGKAASVNKASVDYNSTSVAANSTFQMNLNGTTVQVKVATAIDGKGAATPTTMKDAATTMQTAIQAAVTDYNTQLGLTAGTYDAASGKTGLTTTDFTVSTGDNGNFVVKYTGDQDVDFSFSDVGDKSIASELGIADGSSKSGGNQGLVLQVGDTYDSYNKLNLSISDMHSKALGVAKNQIDISSQEGAGKSIAVINKAIDAVSTQRSALGAIQNRLDHTINNLNTTSENLTSANSRIRDTDMAKEMMNYTQNNVLVQAAQAMLAQANQAPSQVLQLLK